MWLNLSCGAWLSAVGGLLVLAGSLRTYHENNLAQDQSTQRILGGIADPKIAADEASMARFAALDATIAGDFSGRGADRILERAGLVRTAKEQSDEAVQKAFIRYVTASKALVVPIVLEFQAHFNRQIAALIQKGAIISTVPAKPDLLEPPLFWYAKVNTIRNT